MFILLQISLKNPPSFLFPFFLLDLFLSEAECFCSNNAKYKNLYGWEDFLNYSFTLKWHHPECEHTQCPVLENFID